MYLIHVGIIMLVVRVLQDFLALYKQKRIMERQDKSTNSSSEVV